MNDSILALQIKREELDRVVKKYTIQPSAEGVRTINGLRRKINQHEKELKKSEQQKKLDIMYEEWISLRRQ